MKEPNLRPDATLRDAIRVIEAMRKTIAVVLDEERKVLGTISDGDIRRAIISGRDLDCPVLDVMNPSPVTAPYASSNSYLMRLLAERKVEAIPLVDNEGRFTRVVHELEVGLSDDVGGAEGFAGAVIMAGGEGRRLGALTKDTPKPMLDIGGTPLIERSVLRLASAGVRKIYIAINYLSERIVDHLGDGSDFKVEIVYLRERQMLGTAGALSLLKPRPTEPLLVINGDILTTTDFGRLYRYHCEREAVLTVGVVAKHVEIPFGVVQVEGDRATGLQEKPSQRFLCNAGIYSLSSEALDLVPEERFFNMTELIEAAIAAGRVVGVFPLHEYWTDIGAPEDLERARQKVVELEEIHD